MLIGAVCSLVNDDKDMEVSTELEGSQQQQLLGFSSEPGRTYKLKELRDAESKNNKMNTDRRMRLVIFCHFF